MTKRVTKDSGEREVFVTGARRDSGGNKPRLIVTGTPEDLEKEYGFVFDRSQPLDARPSHIEDENYGLIPDLALNRLQALFERGARKYGVNNWERGIPLQRYFESASTHLAQAWAGDTSEDHLAAVLWNIAAIMQTEFRIIEWDLPAELGNAGALKYGNHSIDEMHNDDNDTGHDTNVRNGGN